LEASSGRLHRPILLAKGGKPPCGTHRPRCGLRIGDQVMAGYEGKPWLLKYHNILFDIFNEKYNLEDLEDDNVMCMAVAVTLGRLDYITDASEKSVINEFLADHIKDIEDAKTGFSEHIENWQGNNWRRINVSL